MVLQSELIKEIIIPHLNSLSYKTTFGADTEVNYDDNDLDTEYVTVTNVTSEIVTDNTIRIVSELQSGEGNGNTITAYLIEDTDDNAVEKILIPSIAKTDTVIIKTTNTITLQLK